MCVLRAIDEAPRAGISAPAGLETKLPDSAYSYCSASSTFSLDARLAGRIAASIPARIATPTNTTSVP
jgi:hypothetical protein